MTTNRRIDLRPATLGLAILLGTSLGAGPLLAAGGDTCATAPIVTPGVFTYSDSGSSSASAGDYSTGHFASAGRDVVYAVTLTDPLELHFALHAAFDANIYVATDCSNVDGTWVGGANRMGPVAELYTEFLDLNLTPGTYYVILDAANAGEGGSYVFAITGGPTPYSWEDMSRPYPIATLVPTFSHSGSTLSRRNDYSQATLYCPGSYDTEGPDVVYEWNALFDGNVEITITNDAAPFFVALVESGMSNCLQAWQIWSANPPGTPYSLGTVALQAGKSYELILDTQAATPTVSYTITMSFATPMGMGEDCMMFDFVTPTSYPWRRGGTRRRRSTTSRRPHAR